MAHTVSFIADDFGLHPEIDQGIIELAKRGRIHGVSVLITSQNFSAERFRELISTNVRVGVHLAFTETTPINKNSLPAPWTTPSGSFVPHWKTLARLLLTTPLPVPLVTGEFRSQILALRELGGSIDYVDSHQNIHLLPQFFPAIDPLITEGTIPKLRMYRDPPRLSRPLFSLINLLGRRYSTRLPTLDTFGLFASCNLDQSKLSDILSIGGKADQDFFVLTHPGKTARLSPAAAVYYPPYELRWRQEFELLNGARLMELLDLHGLQIAPVG